MSGILEIVFSIAGVALLYLILNQFGGGGIFSQDIEDIISKACVSFLLLAGVSLLYVLTKFKPILCVIPISFFPLFWHLFGSKMSRSYAKRFSKPFDPDLWICRKCGETNHNIRNECVDCGTQKTN